MISRKELRYTESFVCLYYVRGFAHIILMKILIDKCCDLIIKESLNKEQRG